MNRMDIVGQNGNDGRVYLIEDIAKIIYSSNKVNPRYQWEDFLNVAIEILNRVEKDDV